MTRNEFAEFVETVKRTYRTEAFIETQETFDTWYQYFADYKYTDLIEIFRQYAIDNRFTPQVSDLIPKLRRMKAETDNEIYNHYSALEFVWLGSVSMDCLEKFKKVCRGNANWAKSLTNKGKFRTKQEPELAMSDWLDQQERQVVEWMQSRQ